MWKILVRTDNSASQLVLRLALALVIFPHGAQKVFGLFGGAGLAPTRAAFAAMGFASWAAYLLMFSELVGSLLLALGLLTRIWALAIGAGIAICMRLNHLEHGFFMNWYGRQQGEGIEYHLLVLGMALALVLGGGGALSLDRLFARGQRRGGLVL